MNPKQTAQQETTSTMATSYALTQIVHSQGKVRSVPGNVIVEISVSITVNGEWWISMMCTPTDIEAMAIGFLFNEGIIAEISEVASVRICPHGDNIDIWLTHAVQKPQRWTRTSGCSGGMTGSPPDEKIMFSNGGVLSPMQINDILSMFYQVQALYRQTGGVHTSAISDGQTIVVSAEDIGRHNTLDKLAGHCLMKQLTPVRRILLTTGRISSEMLQKAARLRAPIVISRTSPSSQSVEIAEDLGITLIGYARRGHFVVYTHPERILAEPA